MARVSHPSTDRAQHCLTSVISHMLVLAMNHSAGHFFIFFTYFPTYIYGEEQHFATLYANSTDYRPTPIISRSRLKVADSSSNGRYSQGGIAQLDDPVL